MGPASDLCLPLAALVVLASIAGDVSAQRAGFRVIYEKRGIVVSVRDEPGKKLPTFRGEGTLEGNVLHVLAVLLDDARSTEWAQGADESAVLRVIDPRTRIVYSRSHQPWPVRDRDLVMKRTVDVLEAATAFRITLSCVPGEKPKVDGVLRIEDCRTEITVRGVDDTHTFVDYQVRADAAGDAPTWLVERATRSVPYDTLVALERQVKKTRGLYTAEMREWAAAPKS